MNNCKDCLKPLEQVGRPTNPSFPEGQWCDPKSLIRIYLLKCPECEGLTLLVEVVDFEGHVIDWHYLRLPVDIKYRKQK